MKNILSYKQLHDDYAGLAIMLILSFFLMLNLPAMSGSVHAAVSAVWVNDGGDKVTQDELRVFLGADVASTIWDGSNVSLLGAKNEVISFNLILEAAGADAQNVTVSFNSLTGPGGSMIQSKAESRDTIFNFVDRNIELFFIRYLEIKGLSHGLCYDASYDERHVPSRFRRPWTGEGDATGGWTDRAGSNKFYPDIAIPMALVPQFSIAANSNQSVWVDIYIPKTAMPGVYHGTVTVRENEAVTSSVPVSLTVYDFSLPDYPSAKTMLYYSRENINYRYLGSSYPQSDTPDYQTSLAIINRHFQLAHRHKISLISNYNYISEMAEAWTARLNGSLFTRENGYDGPGVGMGNNVYSIGTYSSWTWVWDESSRADMWSYTDAWVDWFVTKAFTTPTEYFLYLIDESDDYASQEQWAQWIDTNPGPGNTLMSMATISSPTAWENEMPSLDIPTSGTDVGITDLWESATTALVRNLEKRFYYYNGKRPASGSFCIEDDGVALRVNGWIQHKKKIDRWFYWESTYYNNYQAGMGETDVFTVAQTYGFKEPGLEPDFGMGEYGWNYTNGDGVLFYPGTDRHYTHKNFGVSGPFASLRLKHWRRGIQDADYLALANAVDADSTRAIVERMIPKVLWENGVENEQDPTYVYTDISWSTDPDYWEAARHELAAIITGDATPASPGGVLTAVIDTPISDIIVCPGSLVNLSGTVSGGVQPYVYWWDFQSAGNSTLEDPGNVAFPAQGVYQVIFYVRDSLGVVVRDTVTVTVTVANGALTAVIDTPTSDVIVYPGSLVNLSGTVSGGVQPYVYWWDFQSAGNSTLEDPGNVAFPAQGVYQVIFYVRDSLGVVVWDTVTVTAAGIISDVVNNNFHY